MTFARAVIRGKRLKPWKTKPILRLRLLRTAGARPARRQVTSPDDNRFAGVHAREDFGVGRARNAQRNGLSGELRTAQSDQRPLGGAARAAVASAVGDAVVLGLVTRPSLIAVWPNDPAVFGTRSAFWRCAVTIVAVAVMPG